MIKFGWPFRRRNEGASLIAVVTAVVFVMTIGTIVLTVTLTNIRMREVEESGKHNFYGADGVMEELASRLNDEASVAMRDAYTVILEDYRNSLSSGNSIQDKFAYLYMDNLRTTFKDDSKSEKLNPTDDPNLIYAYGFYSADYIKDLLSDENKPYFILADPDNDPIFSADFVDGIFTLHNLRVEYTDDRGYETVISTDMVFHTPTLNFSNNSEIEEYMKYALIADVQIGINGSASSVNGNMYAGYDGIDIHGNASNVTLTGTDIVTRGDINVNSGSTNIKIGGDRSSIWAENVTTTPVTRDSENPSSLTLEGNIYVSDDLTLNAAKSEVNLIGNYYGYNFRKHYDKVVPDLTKSAEYSSAIVINGKKARLDMTGLNYLMLAGRTYIARGSNNMPGAQDVVLGESLSVRTNQLAYYVPDRFLEEVGGTKTLVFESDDDDDDASKAADYADYLNMDLDDLKGFLNESNPVLAYRFLNSNAAPGADDYLYRYYLNFKDDQAANDFFAAYFDANGTRVSTYAQDYADAIIIDDSTMVSLQGDIMKRYTGTDSFDVTQVTITNDWTDADTGVYYNYADQMAKNYMSLQRYLEDWSLHSVEITSEKVRFDNKMDDPVTSSFVDFSLIPVNSEDVSNENGILIAVVGRDYDIITPDLKGIVIATGNVRVLKSFEGMIIAGGSIELVEPNIDIKADEKLVADLFKDDASSDTPRFSHLFFEYGTVDENVLGLINIDKYQTYENWTRTEN